MRQAVRRQRLSRSRGAPRGARVGVGACPRGAVHPRGGANRAPRPRRESPRRGPSLRAGAPGRGSCRARRGPARRRGTPDKRRSNAAALDLDQPRAVVRAPKRLDGCPRVGLWHRWSLGRSGRSRRARERTGAARAGGSPRPRRIRSPAMAISVAPRCYVRIMRVWLPLAQMCPSAGCW